MAARRNKGDGESLFDAPGGGGSSGEGSSLPAGGEERANLHEIAQTRYLNYALSVITSRALPDVRDGMKPVHRRIIYTMWQNGLRADVKHRKCATVVGDVMGRYHPHGDGSIYEALVRMAQSFMMRAPLVDGSGNFGSMDGDPAAAMRYTECRLTPIAAETISEIGQGTVHFRPNYDGTREEPVVLPSKLPNLLLNGSTGIAVGMATNIPPHNLGELCSALLKVLEDPEIKDYQLVANDAVRGPDFPTGGQVLNSRDELREIYKTGQGAIRMRATWEKAAATRAAQVINITSLPYGVNKAELVEAIAQIVMSRKMPLLLDVKDVSTDDVRIELQLKKDAESDKVMAFLLKHTLLQTNFNVNLTCLVPTDNPEVGRPERLGLKEILRHFLMFRLDVVTRRLGHELEQVRKRIHTLEGFAFAFDILDDLIKIIRASEGKADAAERILKKYGVAPHGPRKPKDDGLDPEQVDDILELKLYRLARLEINLIRDELAERNKRAKEIKRLLADEEASGRWGIVKHEIEELAKTFGKDAKNKRRTLIEQADDTEYTAEDFIVAEDNHVLVTADGWVKRQKEINPETTRLREGDRILSLVAGSTRATIVFFSNYGTAYSCRIIDIPATTGYGEPIQKLFKLKDGEKIVAAMSLDDRVLPLKATAIDAKNPEAAPKMHGLAVTSDGYSLRFGFDAFREVSTRSGRRFARPSGEAEVTLVALLTGGETVIAASQNRRVLLCKAEEVNFLGGPGKGVLLIKLDKKTDRLVSAIIARDDRDTLVVKTSMGGEQRLNTGRYKVTGRGGKGHEFVSRGQIMEVIYQPVAAPLPLEGTK